MFLFAYKRDGSAKPPVAVNGGVTPTRARRLLLAHRDREPAISPSRCGRANGTQSEEIANLIDAGDAQVVLSQTFPLRDVRLVHQRIE